MDFLSEMLCYMYIICHRKLIGDISVVLKRTNKSVELTFSKEGGTYTFCSQQYVYTTFSHGWLKLKNKKYLYEVQLTAKNSDVLDLDDTVGIYFANSSNLLKNTTYPHRLAINTHFKRVSEGVGHISKIEKRSDT